MVDYWVHMRYATVDVRVKACHAGYYPSGYLYYAAVDVHVKARTSCRLLPIWISLLSLLRPWSYMSVWDCTRLPPGDNLQQSYEYSHKSPTRNPSMPSGTVHKAWTCRCARRRNARSLLGPVIASLASLSEHVEGVSPPHQYPVLHKLGAASHGIKSWIGSPWR